MALTPRQLAPIVKRETRRTLKAVAPYQTYVGAFFGNSFQGQYRRPSDIFTIDDINIGDVRLGDEDVAMEADRFGSSTLSFGAREFFYKVLRITEMEGLATDVDLRQRFIQAYAQKSAAKVDAYLLNLILSAPINKLGEVDIATTPEAAQTLLEDLIETYDYAQDDTESSSNGLTLLAPPEFVRALLHTPAFVQSEEGARRLFAGEVGTYQGVRVIKSKRTITGAPGARKATLILADGSLGGEKVIDYQTAVQVSQDFRFDGDFLRLKTQYGAIVTDPNRYVTAEVEVSDSKRVNKVWDATVAPGTQTPWGVLHPETKSVGAYTPGGSMAGTATRPAGIVPAAEDLGKGENVDLKWDTDGDGDADA